MVDHSFLRRNFGASGTYRVTHPRFETENAIHSMLDTKVEKATGRNANLSELF